MKSCFIFLSTIIIISAFFITCQPTTSVQIQMESDPKNDTINNEMDISKHSVKESEANFIQAKVVFPAGRIYIEAGDFPLLDGQFNCTSHEWKPEILYSETNDSGKLIIEPSANLKNFSYNDKDTCKWLLKLNPEKIYDIELEIGTTKGDINFENFKINKFSLAMGAGVIEINLKNTSVPIINISAGAGKAIINLTGTWNNDLQAKIEGGVGEIEIHLPKETGIKAEVNGILGDVEADGFIKKHNKYTNSSCGKTEHTLDLEINGAIGKVKLIQE